MNAKEIRELFQKHQVSLSRDDVWEVRPGTPVVKHSPLERLAAAIGVEWDPPNVLRSERDEAVIIAGGRIGDGPGEWSIGEAVIGQNYKVSGKMAAYPYAMAEKRAKDRVILKLAGLHGAYSEEEADDFKQRDNQPPEPPISSVQIAAMQATAKQAAPQPKDDDEAHREAYTLSFCARIKDLSKGEALEYAKAERQKVWREYGIDGNDPYGQRMVKAYKEAVGEAA